MDFKISGQALRRMVRVGTAAAFLTASALATTASAQAVHEPQAANNCEFGYFCWWDGPNFTGNMKRTPVYDGNHGSLEFLTSRSYDNNSDPDEGVVVHIECRNGSIEIEPQGQEEDRPCVNGYFRMDHGR